MENRFTDTRNFTAFVVGGIAAGYMVSHFPPSSLEWTTHPIGQFMIFLLMMFGYHGFTLSNNYVYLYVVEAIIMTFILQVLHHLAIKYDDWKIEQDEKKKIKNTSGNYFTDVMKGKFYKSN